MMSSSNDSAASFGEAWLREQRALWERFSASGTDRDFAAAEQAWNAACDRWWMQVGSAVPAPMATQVHAALQYTRVLLRLARTLAGGGASPGLDAVLDPALLYSAALDAFRLSPGANADTDGEAERAYTRAYAALVVALADNAREAFEAARDRLAHDPVHTPRALYAVYAETIEMHYRARAGSDEFARLVGGMVNAQVDALAERRRGQP